MNWTPPAAARAAAARALAVRATLPRSQRAGTPVGIARAVALRDGRPISLDTARRMLAFFTRSARFENAARPSKAWQAWNLWGGSAARDALERSPMLCLPCMNPRAPVETAAAACMHELAHRSNPPRMPRTAQEARDALAAAYDDAVGRARVGAFRSDLSATRAALDDAARYSYALGFYEAAPAVPYYLLDRLRAPADARQPDLFARSNPAPISDYFARIDAQIAAERAAVKEAYASGITEFEHPRRGTFAAVGADPTLPGRYRVTRYDDRGLSGHTEYASIADALKDLAREGYTQPAPGSLDRVVIASFARSNPRAKKSAESRADEAAMLAATLDEWPATFETKILIADADVTITPKQITITLQPSRGRIGEIERTNAGTMLRRMGFQKLNDRDYARATTWAAVSVMKNNGIVPSNDAIRAHAATKRPAPETMDQAFAMMDAQKFARDFDNRALSGIHYQASNHEVRALDYMLSAETRAAHARARDAYDWAATKIDRIRPTSTQAERDEARKFYADARAESDRAWSMTYDEEREPPAGELADLIARVKSTGEELALAARAIDFTGENRKRKPAAYSAAKDAYQVAMKEHAAAKRDLEAMRASIEAKSHAAHRELLAARFAQTAPAPAAPPSPLEVLGARVEAADGRDLDAMRAAEDAALSSWEPEPPELAAINDRIDLLYQRAMLLARTADAVKGTISRRDARLQADQALSEYEAASRERDKIAAALGVTLPDPLMGVSSPRPVPASKPAKPLDAAGVALLRQREAEAQAAEAEMVRQREGEERREAAWREIEQIAASLPDSIPTDGPLASLSDLDLADQITAPNKRPSYAPEYTAKLKAEAAARGVPFSWKGADALRERAWRLQRMKPAKPAPASKPSKPAPASKPSKPAKPSAPRRPVTGKAREVLARLGALGPVSLADVARVGCTDDTGARRIVAALIRAEAAAPSGPGAWMLDPSRLDECPPQRPRTREPRPVCVGECGRWSAPKDAPAWIAALGPTSTIYDSEGRPYPVRWALARLDDLGDGWHASNVNGRADPKYDRELQARERGTTASRAQVEKIAGSLSLAQWVAPSSTPADSAPVVWIDPSARGHVVSGNGRTAAYALARPSRLAVAETVAGRWSIPKTLRAALEAADLVPVRIMGGPGEIDRAAAVLLAGASQASASGSLTQTERALSTVRALGLTVAEMPALDWPEALTVARLVAFIAGNRAWAAWATAPLAPERAILLSSDPLALTVHFRDVLIGLLPPEAREGGIGGLSIDRALVGALPGIWTLETRIRDGRAPAAWSLVAVLPEARSWAAKSAGRLKELAADAATDERQAGLFGPARLDTAGARLLAVALGGALARASGRTDPEAAGAEMVAALLAAAPDPSQPSLLGIDDADPVEVLARKARLSLPRANPPGRDLERLADAAKRWHWGRYKRAKSARVDRATWQPSQGFALGELAAISLGADRLEVPPGHLLCATEEGGAADLFVVPPLPLGSLAPRPLRAIEYLADKAGDGPSWYVHDFDPAYPVAQTKGGALAIVRRGSRFSIDPERGIVG